MKFWPKNTVKSLENKSVNVMNVFHSTVNNLKNINTEIEQEMIQRKETIKTLQEEYDSLETNINNNNTIINKITNFFN